MKTFKKIVCAVLVIIMLTSLVCTSSLAAGTIAYGAGKVNASALNIRSGQGTNYSIIGTVKNGETVVIIEKTSPSWYRINYNGTSGYVSSEYLKDVNTKYDLALKGEVTDTYVRYRSSPSTAGTVLGSLNTGAAVTVTGIESGWYRLSVSGSTGYMRSDYIMITGADSSAKNNTDKPKEDPPQAPESVKGLVTDNYVNFRTASNTSANIIRMLNKDTEVEILGKEGSWYKISYNGTVGYMSSSYVKESDGKVSVKPKDPEIEVEELDFEGFVNNSYVRMRTGPATSYSIIYTLGTNTSVKVTGRANGWYRVVYNSKTGFIRNDYVTIGKKDPSNEGSERGKEIAEYAKQFEGYRYVYGGASPSGGFDCSGLVYYVYHTHFGYNIERGAGSQYAKSGDYIKKSELQPGDLVFFSSNGFSSVTHVGLYLGGGKFIHACDSDHGVIISDLGSTHYTNQYYGAKRIID